MHPVFQHWRRFLLYLTIWLEAGVALGFLAASVGHITRLEGVVLGLPITFLMAFICLSPFYICRSLPLRSTPWWRLIRHHLPATVAASGAVMLAGTVAAGMLTSVWPRLDTQFVTAAPILTVFVAMTYLFSIALHYTFLEVESSRRIEVLAREAQLKALKAQVNPHFLFNSLNSISALTSLDPARAREMCVGLADFLRASLRLGERVTVPFSEELALTNMYLNVEQSRFGGRLRLIRDIDPACDPCEVPALLIQPLVENAVKHGIAMMAEGGEIHISSQRERDIFRFCISNPFDPDAPAQTRNGIGLRNVRERLEARYGNAAKMHIEATERNYQVTLTFPARTS